MPFNDPEFNALLALSAEVGADPSLVQAAGGNTSIKNDGLMWIKASGTWLMHALQKDIMVPVQMEPLLRAVESGDPAAEKAQQFVPEELNSDALRPSIETTVHLVLPQRIVVHVHCVETIAFAIRQDCNSQLAERLEGFNWISVPYVKPGLTLSQTIQQSLQVDTDVIVLGNHGLVVAAETVSEARDLLQRTCAALRQGARAYRDPDLPGLDTWMQGTDYRLPEFHEAHTVACDPVSLSVASGGSLYPDHVIFLGAGSVVVSPEVPLVTALENLGDTGFPSPVSVLCTGYGVVMRADATAGQQAMAQCLSDVCRRVPENSLIHYLSDDDNAALLNWDAEKYRQALNQ
ncbi:MAG: class II aldolase/adducin family protein [Gammaproteobacteria bacterium]|nr:class II aldolase/adducin family protein [Gammaproteobacteria bacterium]